MKCDVGIDNMIICAKEPMELLSLSSIFRSEKEIQEVDNVLLIQTSDIKKGRKFIQVMLHSSLNLCVDKLNF